MANSELILSHLEKASHTESSVESLSKKNEALQIATLKQIRRVVDSNRLGLSLAQHRGHLLDTNNYDMPPSNGLKPEGLQVKILDRQTSKLILSKLTISGLKGIKSLTESPSTSPTLRPLKSIEKSKLDMNLKRRNRSNAIFAERGQSASTYDKLDRLIQELKAVLREFVAIPLREISHAQKLMKVCPYNPACQYIQVYLENPDLIDSLTHSFLLVDKDLPNNVAILMMDLKDYLDKAWQTKADCLVERVRTYNGLVARNKSTLKQALVQKRFHQSKAFKIDSRMAGLVDAIEFDPLVRFKLTAGHNVGGKV